MNFGAEVHKNMPPELHKDAGRVRRRRPGKWHQPKDPNEERLTENCLVSTAAGLGGMYLKFDVLPPYGGNYESFLAPYAPELFPLLFGISISQINAVEKFKKGDTSMRTGLFSIVQLFMMWQVGKIVWNAASVHDQQSLIAAAICGGGIIMGRGLNILPRQSTTKNP